MGMTAPRFGCHAMQLSELTGEVSSVAVANFFRDLLDGVSGAFEHGSGLGHTPFGNPFFDGFTGMALGQVGQIGRGIARCLGNVTEVDGLMVMTVDKLKDGGEFGTVGKDAWVS